MLTIIRIIEISRQLRFRFILPMPYKYGKLRTESKTQKGRPAPRFHVGDRVRISKAKKTFDEGYLPNWNTELLTVSKRVLGRYSYVYTIQD